MKYGVCTTIEHYALVEETGFDYIELPGHVMAALPLAEFAKVKNTLATGRIPCCGFNAALPPDIVLCGKGFSLAKARDYAKVLCKRGSELNISAIGIGSPKSRAFQNGDSVQEAWTQTEAFLSMFAEEARPYGIFVLYESLNHTESDFGLKLREGADLMKKLDKPNLGLVFDIYHMLIEGENIDELRYALPYVRHVHIAERVGDERRYPSHKRYEDYRQLFAVLADFGYDRAVCTEAFDGDIQEGATRALSLLKELVKETRGENA